MKLFLLLLILTIRRPLISSEQSRAAYLGLLKQYPHLLIPQGDASKGEIEILIDPYKMASIEKSHGRAVGVSGMISIGYGLMMLAGSPQSMKVSIAE